jgi:hypothetical protein
VSDDFGETFVRYSYRTRNHVKVHSRLLYFCNSSIYFASRHRSFARIFSEETSNIDSLSILFVKNLKTEHYFNIVVNLFECTGCKNHFPRSPQTFLCLMNLQYSGYKYSKNMISFGVSKGEGHTYQPILSEIYCISRISHIIWNSHCHLFLLVKMLSSYRNLSPDRPSLRRRDHWARAIWNWTRHFVDGDHSLEDETKIGCLQSTEHVNASCALLVHDPYLLQRKIAFILNIHQGTIKYVLHEMSSFRKVNCKWILYHSDDNQELWRVRLSTEFLEFLEPKSRSQSANV